MLQVLNVCIPSFEYKGQKRHPVKRQNTQSFRKTSDMKERLEECIRGTGSARSDFINRRKDRASNDKLRWRKDQMPYRYKNTHSHENTHHFTVFYSILFAFYFSGVNFMIIPTEMTVNRK